MPASYPEPRAQTCLLSDGARGPYYKKNCSGASEENLLSACFEGGPFPLSAVSKAKNLEFRLLG